VFVWDGATFTLESSLEFENNPGNEDEPIYENTPTAYPSYDLHTQIDPNSGYGYFGYAGSENATLLRFPLANCAVKSSCSACSSTYCGWCYPSWSCELSGVCSSSNLYYRDKPCFGSESATPSPAAIAVGVAASFVVTVATPEFVDGGQKPSYFSSFS